MSKSRTRRQTAASISTRPLVHDSAQYIRVLAQSGANVNCGDKNGSTPLTLSSEEDHLNVV